VWGLFGTACPLNTPAQGRQKIKLCLVEHAEKYDQRVMLVQINLNTKMETFLLGKSVIRFSVTGACRVFHIPARQAVADGGCCKMVCHTSTANVLTELYQ